MTIFLKKYRNEYKIDDLISRQEVISTINVLRTRCDTDDIDDYHDLLVEAIEVLPNRP